MYLILLLMGGLRVQVPALNGNFTAITVQICRKIRRDSMQSPPTPNPLEMFIRATSLLSTFDNTAISFSGWLHQERMLIRILISGCCQCLCCLFCV